MFVDFFYLLRAQGVPVTPTSFLRLQRALHAGLVCSVDDFYVAARSILVKSEKYFDLYDQIFAHVFRGAVLTPASELEIEQALKVLLAQWLDSPEELARALGIDPAQVRTLKPEELLDYFKKTLAEQQEAHRGGRRWIGTGGTSPVGHSGFNPGGMRVGGQAGHFSAVKVALDRRYKDYARGRALGAGDLGEALKRLRHLKPVGPRDRLNIDASIEQTVRNGGDIDIVFDRDLRDRLKLIIAIDNGGWSMYPYVKLVQNLFSHARAQFKDVRFVYFHNTIYDQVWEDASRMRTPLRVVDLPRLDRDTRWIFVGDASMAPYELLAADGSISFEASSPQPSIERLRFIARTFPHCVWINPRPCEHWRYTETTQVIARIFPMYELSLDGLDAAVRELLRRR